MADEAQRDAPRPITRRESHDKVMALIETLPRGDILDAQCGEGALAERLRDAGFRVRCCDIDPGLMKAQGLESKPVDLNTGRIEYDDGAFDYVASTNGLHRLYNIDNALQEFARVLRPAGKVIISIPNYSTIVRRMRFLLTGAVAKNIVRHEFKQVTGAPQAHFRQPLGLPRLRSALEASGFAIESITKARTQKRALWLSPIALAVKLVAPLVYRRDRALYGLDLANSPVVLLGGHHVIVIAAKVR